MTTFFARKQQNNERTENLTKVSSPEVSSAMVRIAHKLSSNSTKGQVVKIADKYYRIKELG
jgi:CRISPR/Cas system-associated endonuclease Cas1